MNGCSAPWYSVNTIPSARRSCAIGYPAIASSSPVLSTTTSGRNRPVATSTSADLVVPGGWTGEVFDDVQARAVGRESVVLECAGQLDDPRCRLGPAVDERHLDDGEPAVSRRRVGGLPVLDKDRSLPVRRHADGRRVGADRRQPPATFERLGRTTEARLDDEVADGRRGSVSGRSQHTTPRRVRDAVGQVVQHLAGAREDDARTRRRRRVRPRARNRRWRTWSLRRCSGLRRARSLAEARRKAASIRRTWTRPAARTRPPARGVGRRLRGGRRAADQHDARPGPRSR